MASTQRILQFDVLEVDFKLPLPSSWGLVQQLLWGILRWAPQNDSALQVQPNQLLLLRVDRNRRGLCLRAEFSHPRLHMTNTTIGAGLLPFRQIYVHVNWVFLCFLLVLIAWLGIHVRSTDQCYSILFCKWDMVSKIDPRLARYFKPRHDGTKLASAEAMELWKTPAGRDWSCMLEYATTHYILLILHAATY